MISSIVTLDISFAVVLVREEKQVARKAIIFPTVEGARYIQAGQIQEWRRVECTG